MWSPRPARIVPLAIVAMMLLTPAAMGGWYVTTREDPDHAFHRWYSGSDSSWWLPGAGGVQNVADDHWCCPNRYYTHQALTAPVAVEMDIAFHKDPGGVVGRHGGLRMTQYASIDWDAVGYSFDWIDRAWDHGFRVMDVAGHYLQRGNGPEPVTGTYQRWRIEIGATELAFQVNGVEVMRFQHDPYDGPYYLGVWAYKGTEVRFDNVEIQHFDPTPPRVELLRPEAGAMYVAGSEVGSVRLQTTVVGDMTLALYADDDLSGIGRKEVLIDNTVLCSSTTAGTQYCHWDTSSLFPGEHTIRAHAIDVSGNEAWDNMSVIVVPIP